MLSMLGCFWSILRLFHGKETEVKLERLGLKSGKEIKKWRETVSHRIKRKNSSMGILKPETNGEKFGRLVLEWQDFTNG